MFGLPLETLSFSLFDIMVLMGVGQSLYITVYLLFRSGRISRGSVALAYFINMALLLGLMFFESRAEEVPAFIFTMKWFLWMLQAPLGCLLIIQVAQIYKVPSLGQYWVLLPPVLAYGVVQFAFRHNETCFDGGVLCDEYKNALWLGGVFASALALGSIWWNKTAINDLMKERNHKERYWLILALIFVNAAFIATVLFLFGLESMSSGGLDQVMVGFALALVYLSGTSLFRIYPQAVHIAAAAATKKTRLSVEEIALAERVEDLVFTQKVYHEHGYNRTAMAQECGVAEATLSRVISVYFGKTFPQLLNDCRVGDAKRLLRQSDEPVQVIAKEVGFNSLPSFNRVFKTTTGDSPKSYRDKHR